VSTPFRAPADGAQCAMSEPAKVPTAAFLAAFAITVAAEGAELDLTRADRGNWTGGAVGRGELRGSKYGISAASYPTLDIAGLTEADARAIYARDFWAPIAGDALPPAVALVLFDAAVNNGRGGAVMWLQAAVGVTQDRGLGAITLAAVATHDPLAVAQEMHRLRGQFMIHDADWDEFRDGWEDRLLALPWRVLAAVGRMADTEAS
jgi:lysozyme family protein